MLVVVTRTNVEVTLDMLVLAPDSGRALEGPWLVVPPILTPLVPSLLPLPLLPPLPPLSALCMIEVRVRLGLIPMMPPLLVSSAIPVSQVVVRPICV